MNLINWKVARFLTIIFFTISFVISCGAARQHGKDSELERRINIELNRVKSSGALTSLDLQSLTKGKLQQVCYQAPYIDKNNFEKSIGRSAGSFEEISDDVYVLWFFFEDGSSSWINISRMATMNLDTKISADCVTGMPTISFKLDGVVIEYFIQGA